MPQVNRYNTTEYYKSYKFKRKKGFFEGKLREKYSLNN